MPRVHLAHLNRTINVPEGAPLTALEGDLPFGCKAAACGRCAVEVKQGLAHLSPPTAREARALQILKLPQECVRLACQARVLNDVSLQPWRRTGK